MEHFRSQTQLLLDTGTVQSTVPLNDIITDTVKVSYTVLLSRQHGRGSGTNVSSLNGSVAIPSADMWQVEIPEPPRWHGAPSIQPMYSRLHEPQWMHAMAHTDVVAGGTCMFLRYNSCSHNRDSSSHIKNKQV